MVFVDFIWPLVHWKGPIISLLSIRVSVCAPVCICNVFSQETTLTIFFKFGMKFEIRKCSKVSKTDFKKNPTSPFWVQKEKIWDKIALFTI